MSRYRDYPNWLFTILGIKSESEIEWEPPKVSKKAQKGMRARAAVIGKIILADWLADAEERSARTAAIIAADAEDQCRRDEEEAARLDWEDSIAIARRMVEAFAPALDEAIAKARKERKAMNRAIQRERDKLAAEGRKLARAKLSRLCL